MRKTGLKVGRVLIVLCYPFLALFEPCHFLSEITLAISIEPEKMGKMFSQRMHSMPLPKNFLHYDSPGLCGTIEMSGMFTVMKVCDNLDDGTRGDIKIPPGTMGSPETKEEMDRLLKK